MRRACLAGVRQRPDRRTDAGPASISLRSGLKRAHLNHDNLPATDGDARGRPPRILVLICIGRHSWLIHYWTVPTVRPVRRWSRSRWRPNIRSFVVTCHVSRKNEKHCSWTTPAPLQIRSQRSIPDGRCVLKLRSFVASWIWAFKNLSDRILFFRYSKTVLMCCFVSPASEMTYWVWWGVKLYCSLLDVTLFFCNPIA